MVFDSRPNVNRLFGLSTRLSWDGVNNYTNQVVQSQAGGQTRNWDRTSQYFYKKLHGIPLVTRNFDSIVEVSKYSNGSYRMFPTANASQFTLNNGVTDASIVGGMYIPLRLPGLVTPADLASWVGTVTDANLLEKIKDDKINLAQTFAEVQQTANLLTSTARKIIKSIIYLKKGNVLSAARSLVANGYKIPKRTHRLHHKREAYRGGSAGTISDTDVASDFLSLQYGWRPLLSDVYGAAEALAVHNNRPKFKTVKVKYFLNSNNDFPEVRDRFCGFGNLCPIVDLPTHQRWATKSVTFSITNNAAKTISETGISNPALLAWELVPFSFVADWFLPVGGFLSAFDATAGCTFHNSTVSARMFQRWKSSAVGKAGNAGGFGNWTYVGNLEAYYSKETVVRRYVNTWPSNRFPDFKNPLSLEHMANSIALLTVLTRGRR